MAINLYKRNKILISGRKTGVLILLFFASLFISFVPHPYYISVTEVDFFPLQKEVQVACKIFTDDFEEALSQSNGRRIKLVENFKTPATDSLIVNYLKKHLQLEADGRMVNLRWVGKEIEGEAVWCYLSAGQVSAEKHLSLNNDLLYHYREDQVNIVHLKADNIKNSCRLVYPQKNCRLQLK
jgi:hypothetical protein